MARFPVDAPIRKVIKAFESLGFRLMREGNYIAMVRESPDGTRTPLTMPNHRRIKGFDAAHHTHAVWYIPGRVPESLQRCLGRDVWIL